MTKLEIMKSNKKQYQVVKEAIKSMNGLQKMVAEVIILEWISSNNWLGGLSDSKAKKLYRKVMVSGYTFEEVRNEVDRQMTVFA